jgi:hypothetical protein
MKPNDQVMLWLTLAMLMTHPPQVATIPTGYQTADQRRAFTDWEQSIERTIEAWQRNMQAERMKDAPLIIEVIIEGLLSRDDSDSAQRAGWALATLWQARKTVTLITTEAQTTEYEPKA